MESNFVWLGSYFSRRVTYVEKPYASFLLLMIARNFIFRARKCVWTEVGVSFVVCIFQGKSLPIKIRPIGLVCMTVKEKVNFIGWKKRQR